MGSEPGSAGPTLHDVAATAGVSVSTAARVLRDPERRIDPVLAKRVRIAAEQLHYVPNVLARNLRGKGSTTVGLIVGDMLDPYFGTIAETVTETAESEYSMVAIVSNMQRSPELELKHCRQLWEHRVSGLILAGGGFDQYSHFEEFKSLIGRIQGSGVTVVSLSPRRVEVPTFCVNNTRVGVAMARALLALGHGDIGILMGSALNDVSKQRTEGAVREIRKAGGRHWILNGEYTPEAGAELAHEILVQAPEITGLIVGADAMAFGVVAGLQQSGYQVPDDISVISSGNTRLASWSAPRITTVDLELARHAQAALSYIAAGVDGALLPAVRAGIPKLVAGNSTAQARKRTGSRRGPRSPAH
jgi:LacI family transcriptional regulator